MWHWEPDKLNNRFQLLPAGNEYYRIKAMHSENMMEVYGGNTEEGKRLLQYQLTDVDNQLFKLVPVIDEPLDASPRSYHEVDEIVRTGILGLIGATPKVGGALSFLVGQFWSGTDKMADLWNQMKVYVDSRISESMEKAHLTALRLALDGQLAKLNWVNELKARKGENVEGLIREIIGIESFFFKQSTGVVPYLMGLGTIMITLHHMMLNSYEELFGHPPTAAEADANLAALKTTIKKYTDEVERQRNALMTKRMAHIRDWDYIFGNFKIDAPASPTPTEIARARDTYDGWMFYWGQRSPDNITWDWYRAMAAFAIGERRSQIAVQYEVELNAYLHPAKYWKYFLPDAGVPEKQLFQKETGSYGGLGRTVRVNQIQNAGRIKQVITYVTTHDQLTGIELIFENNTSTGIIGSGDYFSKKKLALQNDEYITSVYGFRNGTVHGLWLTTQKGRMIGGGQKKDIQFSADLSDVFNPKLTGITGYHDGKIIEQLTFHWEYED